MFADSYQGGASVEIFSTLGKDPFGVWKISGGKQSKVFDKTVRGYVFVCEGGPQNKMTLPKDDKKGRTWLTNMMILF